MSVSRKIKRDLAESAILLSLSLLSVAASAIEPATTDSGASKADAATTNAVVLKEDPRLSVSLSLSAKERTAREWAESIGDAAHLPLVLPEESKAKKLLLFLDKKPLRDSLDAIGDALRLTWKLSKDRIVFEPAKIDPAEEMVDAWPADAREILDMTDEEKWSKAFETAGGAFDHLTAEERAALSTGRLIDAGQLQPETRERLWNLWLYANVKRPRLNFLDPNLFDDGSLSLTENGNTIELSIRTSSFGVTHHWEKGSSDFPFSYDPPPLHKAILVQPGELPPPR